MTIKYINEGIPTLAPELRTLPAGSVVWPVFHDRMLESSDSSKLIDVLSYKQTNQILKRAVNIGVYRIAPVGMTLEIGFVGGLLNLHLFPEPVKTLNSMTVYDSRNYTTSIRGPVYVAGFAYNPLDLLPRKIK